MKIHWTSIKILCLCTFALFPLFAAGSAGAVTGDPFAEKKSAEIVSTGDDSPVNFTLGIGAGYLTGEATELVYWPEYGNHKASELTWEIDSLYMFGVNAELEIFGWITAKLDTWFKVTDGEATMDDYDWLAVGGDWTDWSHHEDTDVTDAYMIDLSADMALFRSTNAAFSAIIGYKLDNFGWEARGGEYVYSSSGFRNSTGSFNDGELGISYEQTYSAFYFGIGTELNFSNFKTGARIVYAPYVYAEATDNHHLRNLVTYDTFDEFGEGDMIGIDIAASYSFTDSLSLGLTFTYQAYSTMTGDSEWHYSSTGTVITYEDGAGADLSYTMLVTTLTYTF